MKHKIWSQEDCAMCDKVKAAIGEYREYCAKSMISGHGRNEDAMTQLAMQNMSLPVVQKPDGTFMTWAEILEIA